MTVSVMIFYFAAFLLLALKDYHWQGFALMVDRNIHYGLPGPG